MTAAGAAQPGRAEAALRRRASPFAFVALVAVIACGALVLAGLGVWQLQRLAWKQALIARVDQRIQAPPVPAPGPAAWPGIDAERDEYRRVSLEGRFLNDRETLVQASTARGGGFWVMTPLRTDEGFDVLVNRGFVPPDRREAGARREGQVDGPVHVVGLLRLSEPKGGFLRANDPQAGRWYSRDVGAIAAAQGLGAAAPYFVDADASANPGGLPAGGLTVVSFPNNHLVYALTWFTLALMLGGAGVHVFRDERRRRGGATA